MLTRSSPQGKLALATVTLGSGVALLDGTVVNIAVKQIGLDLHASLTQLQWVLNGYGLSLAALVLVGGALGDRLGRRRIYVLGIAGFAVASAGCALAQTPEQLVAMRVVQGIFGALMTPGALSIIQSSFAPEDRASAIGTWAGVSGIAAAIGPFVGGFLLEHAGWRWIFAINLPLCALVLFLARYIPESRDEDAPARFDWPGAVSGVIALASLTYLLTSWREASGVSLVTAGVLAVMGVVWFVLRGRREGAMMPLALFRDRVFSAANLMTFLVYGALGAVLFLLVLQLQVSAGYGPIAAGVATLPITIAMLLLSSRFAALAQSTGPRLPMTLGPIVCGLGVLLLAGVGPGTSYWIGVLPGMVLFSLGLAGLVSPLTAAVLAAAPNRLAGVASGVNNAVARTGSLFAVAALPAAVGLAAHDYTDPSALTHGYHLGQLICAGLLVAGGVVSWFGLAGTTPATTAAPATD